jgi:hypothetical protein
LNQAMVASGAQQTAGLGNLNPGLYSLAQTTSNVFHDIVDGNNVVTVKCTGRRSFNCSSIPVGFQASEGYDQASGLGSVDAYNLVTAWTSAIQH